MASHFSSVGVPRGVPLGQVIGHAATAGVRVVEWTNPSGAQLERFEVFADEEAYRAGGTPFAVRSLVPSGLFSPGVVGGGDRRPTRAEAILSGVVASAERRRNERFGGEFWHVVVDTLELEVDLAVDPALVPQAPEAGQICSATAWLLGRLGEPVRTAGSSPR